MPIELSNNDTHVYRTTLARKTGSIFLGLFFVVAGFVVSVRLLHDYRDDGVPNQLLGAFLCFAIILAMAAGALGQSRQRLIVSPNEVTLQGMFSSTTIPLDKLRGRRTTRGGKGGVFTQLEQEDGSVLTFGEDVFQTDEFYANWLQSLPDLDKSDQEAKDEARQREIEERHREGKHSVWDR